jgi:hypothetical protein
VYEHSTVGDGEAARAVQFTQVMYFREPSGDLNNVSMIALFNKKTPITERSALTSGHLSGVFDTAKQVSSTSNHRVCVRGLDLFKNSIERGGLNHIEAVDVRQVRGLELLPR